MGKKIMRYFFIFVALLYFSTGLHSQIQPGKLKKEIMESQQPSTPKTPVRREKRKPKALKAMDPVSPVKTPFSNPKSRLIYVEKADKLLGNKVLRPDIQVLKGNVCFRQEGTYLYCDSAYLNEKSNSFDAFGNVSIVQGDTLFVYGDILYYDGNTKLAKLRRNVRMVNKKTTLTTDSLNYDRMNGIAYYFKNGKIDDDENVLTSVYGEYTPESNHAVFKQNVKMKNKEFLMDSEILNYNTRTHIADIVGDAHMIYKDETNVYSNKGWYNTSTNRSMLLNRSKVIHKEGKTITGDTIFYDKLAKYGESFGNIVLTDSIEKKTLTGNYLYYNEENDKGLATDSALLTDWSSKDTMYVHADTLMTYKDSIYNIAKAWYGVRIFRNDIQGICDSLSYTSQDSTISFWGKPVLWHESNQLTGDFIKAFTKNRTVEKLHIEANAMAIEKVDSIYFNQISGKEIIAHLDSGQLFKVEVSGNAETIYLPIDEADHSKIGVNKTESSFVVMYFKDKKIDKIILTSASSGAIYPLGELKSEDLYLKNYSWQEDKRPLTSFDLIQFPH